MNEQMKDQTSEAPEPKEHFHGSDLEKIEKIYGIRQSDIVSFSANVNPLGISGKLKRELAGRIDVITSYPDREYTSLRKSIASYVDCNPDHIMVGNGSTELISLFISVTAPKKALVLGPTYSEYEREIALVGGRCEYYPLKKENDFAMDVTAFLEAVGRDTDLVVLCNPNNPTSSLIARGDMERIVKYCRYRNTYVMIDETYMEFADNVKASSAIALTEKYDNLIILRGTSKFFAAPGLRLGYAVIGNKKLIEHIGEVKNPWMINSLAVVAGELMFSDEEYIRQTRDLILYERNRLYNIFSESSRFKPYPAQGNFILLEILDKNITSDMLFDHCIRKGLMIRDCSTFPYLGDRFVRICMMMPDDNDRVVRALHENITV